MVRLWAIRDTRTSRTARYERFIVSVLIGKKGPNGTTGPQGQPGPRGFSVNLDQIGILNEATIAQIIADYNATNCLCTLFHGNNTYYYFYVTVDERANNTQPPPLVGNMTGHIIVYTGSTWIDLGDGQLNLQGDVSSVGIVTTINDNVITNAMIKEPIQDYNLATISSPGKVSNSATTASVINTPNSIVQRDVNGSTYISAIFFNDSGSTPLKSYAEYTFVLDVANQLNITNNNVTLYAVKTGSSVCISFNQISYSSASTGPAVVGNTLAPINFPAELKGRNTKYLTSINLAVGGNYTIGSTVFRSDMGVFTFNKDPNNGFTSNTLYQILPFDFCYVTL